MKRFSRWIRSALLLEPTGAGPRSDQLRRSQESVDDESAYKPIDWRLVRRMLGLLAPYRSRYALGIGLGLIMVSLEMLGPLFIREIINTAAPFASGDPPPGSDAAAATRRVAGTVLIWAVAFAAAVLLQRASILVMTGAGERVQFDLRRRVFSVLQQHSMSYFDRNRLGRIISRCTSDIGSLRDVNVWGLDTVIKNLLMMIIAAGMLLATAPSLFLAVAWLAPLLYLANRLYRTRASQAHQVAREGYTRVAANLAENITGARVVSAFNRQSWNLGVFNSLQERNTINNVQAARINGVYQPLLQLIGVTGRVILLLLGGYHALEGPSSGRVLSIGAVVAALLYWDWFMQPILAFGNFHNQLIMAMAGAERVFDLLDSTPDVVDRPGAQPLPVVRGHIRFECVTFGYDPSRPVLHDIDFEIAAGSTLALVGATGSGKSSIVSLIARFYEPQHGRVLIDDRDVADVTGESLRRQLGIVPQSNFLFSGTVLDNLRYGRPDTPVEAVRRAAADLGTLDIIESLPQGFETPVGERGGRLSLGQRQLICFTRAYLCDPRVLLLDEATSAVDTATERVLQESLERLRTGRTTVIVAHRLSTIERADSILVLEHGRIIERGSHRELIALGGRYARLHGQFVRDGQTRSHSTS